MKIDSQNRKILEYLNSHPEGITSMQAFQNFRITRLSGRIFELRKNGYPIETRMKHNSGDPAHKHAVYYLQEDITC